MKKNIASELKRILSIVLIITIVFGNSIMIHAEEDSVEIGTKNNPYIISDIEDFDLVRNNLDAYFILDTDINLEAYDGKWETIGSYEQPFEGHFNGNGHKIYNLKEFVVNEEVNRGYYGIFGHTDNCEIFGLGIEMQPNYEMVLDKAWEYNGAFGLLVAEGTGIVKQCYAIGDIRGNAVDDAVWHGSMVSTTIGSANYAGILCGAFDGTIEECYTQGNIDIASSWNAIDTYVGGVVGVATGNIRNCYSISNICSNAFCLSSSNTAMAGGVVSGVYSTGKIQIENCYHVGVLKEINRVTGSLTDKATSLREGVVRNIEHSTVMLGGVTYYVEMSDCFYLNQGMTPIPCAGNAISKQEMVNEETYSNWDFDNIWIIDPMQNEGFPYLRNIGKVYQISDITKENLEIDYSICDPKNGSSEVMMDQSIIINFNKEIQISGDTEEIRLVDENGNQISIGILINETETGIIISHAKLKALTKYYINIPEGVIAAKDGKSSFAGVTDFCFTTNLFTEEPQDGLWNYVTLEYDKILGIYNDTDVPPFPSNDIDEYIAEFKGIAHAIGYEEIDTLGDEEIRELLNSEFSVPVVSTTNNMFLTKETNKTIKEVLRDLCMLEQMQKYIMAEEERTLANPTVEYMESSTKTMINYYKRYQQYLTESNETTNLDPITVTHSLLNIADIASATWGVEGDEKLLLPGLFELESVVLSITQEGRDILTRMTDSNGSNSTKALEESNQIVHLFNTAKAVYEGDIIDVLFELPDEIQYFDKNMFDKISDTFNLDENRGYRLYEDIRTYRNIVKKVKRQFSYVTTDIGRYSMSVKIITAYMEKAIELYSFINDQYPAWVFYTQYYLQGYNPQYYNHIYGGKNTIELDVGQGMFTSEQYEAEENIFVKELLLSPLYENNINMDGYGSIYFKQYDALNTQNMYDLVSMADLFFEIRTMDILAYQRIIVQYAMEKKLHENDNLTKVVVACPTRVEIINEDTEETVFSLENGQSYESNFEEFGVFYLLGNNKDIKEFILKEGYEVKIIPMAEGTMDCSVAYFEGENVVEQNNYCDIQLDMSSEYYVCVENDEEQVIEVVNSGGDICNYIYPDGEEVPPNNEEDLPPTGESTSKPSDNEDTSNPSASDGDASNSSGAEDTSAPSVGDGNAGKPSDDEDTSNPSVSDGDVSKPSDDEDTSNPSAGDGDAGNPSDDGDTSNPSVSDGDVSKPSDDEDTSTSFAGDGDASTPGDEDTSTSSAGDGDASTSSGDGDTSHPFAGDGDASTPDDEDTSYPSGSEGDIDNSTDNDRNTSVLSENRGNTDAGKIVVGGEEQNTEQPNEVYLKDTEVELAGDLSSIFVLLILFVGILGIIVYVNRKNLKNSHVGTDAVK